MKDLVSITRDFNNTCKVVSKYFAQSPVMDESSLRNNKEKQGNSSNSQKKAAKVHKKPRKRVKGQKDIRTLIKPKKNELVTYSKDFDLICKQSGIDVDSEQLQLAIALSKSLQDSETVNNSNTHSKKSLTSNQRKGRIRTTLQEYGFKVPDTKYCKTNKAKRYRKQYKLLLATDIEKQERIANKYAQILFTNVRICSVNENSINCENPSSFLYHITTNISYEQIKNKSIFYVNNLVEKSLTERHHTLKDWSKIPGRPKSPKRELSSDIKFKSLECSQEELVNILSGTIKTAQEIVKRIYSSNKLSISSSKEDNNNTKDPITHTVDAELKDTNSLHLEIKEDLIENTSIEDFITNKSIVKETFTMPPPATRSCSPDIFDDEVTIIMDKSKDASLQEDLSDRPMVRELNDYMDLTECVNVLNCNTTNFKHNPYLSQENNRTRINPNDFMELTGCVTACSQKIAIGTESENFTEKENCSPNVIIKNSQKDVMDLTQSSNSNNSSQVKNDAYDTKSLDDTIIVVNEDYNNLQINGDRNLSKLTTEKSDIIDLVTGPQFHNMLNHNSVINLMQSPEEDETDKKETNNLDFRRNHIDSFHLDTANSIENHKSPRCNSVLEDNNVDTMDLTQSSHSEDSLSGVQMREGPENASVITASNDETEKDLIENQRNSPGGSNCNNDNQDHYGDTNPSNSPIFMNDYDFYRFDSPLNDDIPFNFSDSPDQNKIGVDNQEDKNQAMDLTQSSRSEDSIDIIQEPSSDVKSLDDTIVLNDKGYYSHGLVDNDIIVGEINPVNVENYSPDQNKSLQISQDKCGIIINECPNHQSEYQFSDVIENVSKFKRNPELSLKRLGANKNNNSFEINICNKNHERDISKYSEIKISSPNCLNSPSVKDNDNSDSNSTNACDRHGINDDCDEENHEIDLTQHSDGAEDILRPEITEVTDDVGERYNFSIVYDNYVQNRKDSDDIIMINPMSDHIKRVEKENSGSIEEAVTSSSQNTVVFEISDDEFNYSVNQTKEDNKSIRLDHTRFNIGGISTIDEFLNRNSLSKSKLRCSCSSDPNSKENKDNICIPEITFTNDVDLLGVGKKSKSCTEIESIMVSTPSKSMNNENILFAQTPKHNDYIIKTDVTPLPNYEMMTSPERNEELDKFGIKPLKRKRAIQILTHIYNQTHPVMEVLSDTEDYSSPSKIRKRNEHTSLPRRVLASQIDLVTANNCIEPGPSLHVDSLSQKSSKSCMEMSKNSKKSPQRNIDVNKECYLYEETEQLPDIRNIECYPEDWVFQKREKAKVHSCRVPLHIAFHNYVSCRRALREAILRYESINIDDIHKGLVATGYRYNPKDLLKFMDKKCITVKTAENTRNNKK